ncbi:MAG: hypothetical protein ABJN84_09355 [Flavobacteriaceae bacterium]
MRKTCAIGLLVGLLLNACTPKKQTSEVNDLSSDESGYFGQKPPGLMPEVLPKELLATGKWKLGGLYAPKKEEFYLTTTDTVPFGPTVVFFRKENRAWKQYDFYATGNDTLYCKDTYIERTDTGWSAIKSLGPAFEDIPIMRLTASAQGTLVFDEGTRDGNGMLRYSRLINGKREAPKLFGPTINTGKWTAHPFIAPDESYLIWDSEREGGYGDSDMYISFKQDDGSWGKAINFGDKINTYGEDGGGYVTPDGKYLSYCPHCDPPYESMWLDAKIIEDLRMKQ